MYISSTLPEYQVSVKLIPKDMTIKRYKKEGPLLTGNQFLAVCGVWTAILLIGYLIAHI